MSEDKSIVKSVGKAFAVLQSFSPTAQELVLADVARAANMDNATAHRLLKTLVELGYIERVPDSRRFRLSLKCLDLGFNAIARSDLRSIARPLLRDMLGARVEAASLGILDGADVVYIERIQAGFERLGVDVRVGNRVPAYSSALGRAILSGLPVESQKAILASSKPRRLTEHTELDVERILARIAEATQLGYAVVDQETVAGIRVIAAPITDRDGVPNAAVSAAAPTFRGTLGEFVEESRDQILDIAKRLSLAVSASGGVAPSVANPAVI